MRKAYFLAETIKCRHTSLFRLVAAMPLVSTLLAAALTYEYFAIDSYNWWYMVLFPGMTAIVGGLIIGKDKKLKNRAVWTLPVRTGNVWDAKLLLGCLASGLSVLCVLAFTLLTGSLLKNGLHFHFAIEPTLGEQAAACLLIWVTSLWQIPFCMLLAEKLGTFAAFLLHMGSYFLIAPQLFSKAWFALAPGAITARLMCAVLKLLPNGLPATEGNLTFSPELLDQKSLLVGIPAALLWFAFFWRLGRTCYEREVEG